VSLDGRSWSEPVAEGVGGGEKTEIVLREPIRARFVRITQTSEVEKAPAWGMQELQVYEVRGLAR
jgi:hypothetical protein